MASSMERTPGSSSTIRILSPAMRASARESDRGVSRNLDDEARAALGGVLDTDRAAVLGPDALDAGEPEPRTLRLRRHVGGEERLADRDGDTGTAIAHLDTEGSRARIGPRHDRDLSLAPHRRDRVVDEVDQRAPHLLRVHAHDAEIG